MKPALAQNVGVDIAKDTLDVAILPAGESFRLANDPGGHRALIKRLGRFEISRIVFEATGAYHRLFERAIAEAGLPLVKVNPSGQTLRLRPRANSPKPTAATPSCWPAWAPPSNSSPASRPAKAPTPCRSWSAPETPSSRTASQPSTERPSHSTPSSNVSSPGLRQIDRQIQAIDRQSPQNPARLRPRPDAARRYPHQHSRLRRAHRKHPRR